MSQSSPHYLEAFMPLILQEYQSLKQEISNRIQFQHQILGLTLVVFGGIIAAGLQSEKANPVLLVYPILAVFLVAEWTRHTSGIFRVVKYIREKFESREYGLGWETWLKQGENTNPYLNRHTVSPGGTFIFTQIITVVLGVSQSTFGVTDIILLVFDSVAITGTVILFVQHAQDLKRRGE